MNIIQLKIRWFLFSLLLCTTLIRASEPNDPNFSQQWALKEFFRHLYQGNPRGRLPTVSTLKGISRYDIEKCHRLHYTPDNMFLAISGDIDREEVERIV